MVFVGALEEVLDAASQPKQYPPGVTPISLSGAAIDTEGLKGRAWHDSLTPAQEMVCRWVWENCAQHYEPWERFEVGFLYDYNTSHELAIWVRIAMVFKEFVQRHPIPWSGGSRSTGGLWIFDRNPERSKRRRSERA